MCSNSDISFAVLFFSLIHIVILYRYSKYYHCIFLLSCTLMQLIEGLIWEGIGNTTKLIWPLIYWLPVGSTLGMYIEKKSQNTKWYFYITLLLFSIVTSLDYMEHDYEIITYKGISGYFIWPQHTMIRQVFLVMLYPFGVMCPLFFMTENKGLFYAGLQVAVVFDLLYMAEEHSRIWCHLAAIYGPIALHI